MARIKIDLDRYRDGLPTHGSYKVDALRMSVGVPPGMSREQHIAGCLRVGADILNKAASKLERGEEAGKFTSHLKIPKGDW